MSTKNYTLVDICWTLYYSNTTFDFLDSFVQTKSYKRLRHAFRNPLLKNLNLLLYKTIHFDLQRTLAVRFLRGIDKRTIEAAAQNFYENYLLKHKIDSVWNLLPTQNLLIATGTLDVIAQVVAYHIGAEVVTASHLIYDNNGLCTGRFTDNLLTKADLLKYYANFNIFTDNLTDLQLVKHAQQAYIVEYGNITRWQKHLTNTQVHFIHATQNRY